LHLQNFKEFNLGFTMYAIVDIAGQQYKVEKGQELFVHQLDEKEGSNVDFSNVLLIDNNGKVVVGQPSIEGAKITATVIEHQRGDKVQVFKKKRRKGYQTLNGHRQYFTKIQIEAIAEKGAKKAAAAKKEEKVEAVATEKKAAAPKTTKAAAPKKAAAKVEPKTGKTEE
jgi:large subunit ribosomal protein L21